VGEPPEALELDEPPLPDALDAAVEGDPAAAGAASGAGAGAGAAAVAGAGAGAGLDDDGAAVLLVPPAPLSLLPQPATVNSTARATGMVRCRMEWSVVVRKRNRAATCDAVV